MENPIINSAAYVSKVCLVAFYVQFLPTARSEDLSDNAGKFNRDESLDNSLFGDQLLFQVSY